MDWKPDLKKLSSPQPPSVHTTALTLGWAVYQPFDTEHPLTEDETLQLVKPVSLELKSGPGFTPTIIPYSAHNACYKVCTSRRGEGTTTKVVTDVSGAVNKVLVFLSVYCTTFRMICMVEKKCSLNESFCWL